MLLRRRSAVWACTARRQASGVVLGRIQPVPMSRHVAALQKALRDRDQWAEKKAERYEAECPKFEAGIKAFVSSGKYL
ncbi:hypothetical protein DIPPA_15582 [Diplonema papillatum]|nr:hypothetical protein DIPPA_15582 [Diplonema papillatum]